MTTRWPLVPLRNLGTWYGGGTPSKSTPGFWNDGDVPWLSPKDMGADVLQGTQDHITTGAVAKSSVRLVPADSVAVVVRSGILERKLPVARVPFATTLNQDMKAIHVREGVDPRWVALGLRAYEHELLTTTRKSGTTVASIDSKKFQDFELPLPPLAEQRQIAEILEDHLSRLDVGATTLSTATKRLEALFASKLRSTFGGDLRDAPRAHIGDVIAQGRRLAYGVLQPGPDIRDGVPLVRVGDLTNLGDGLDLKQIAPEVAGLYPRTTLEGGEVLLSVVGTIGRTAVVPRELVGANVARAIAVFPVASSLIPAFAAFALRDPRVQQHLHSAAHEVARKTLNLEDVRRVDLPVPSLEVQHRVIADLADLETQCQRLASAAAALTRRSEGLRRSLLAAAFSGRLIGSASDIEHLEELAGAPA